MDLVDRLVVVDTSVISYLVKMKGRRLPKDLKRAEYYSNLLEGREMLRAFPTEAELLAWPNSLEEGDRKERCAQGVKEITEQTSRIDPDTKVMAKWAEIATKGRKTGRIHVYDAHNPKRESQVNDVWIAACALALGLPLVSDNRRDFEWMEDAVGLRLISFRA
jgi:predicted nucleic acid-binding protein